MTVDKKANKHISQKMSNYSFNSSFESTTLLKCLTEVNAGPISHHVWIYTALKKQSRSAPRRWQVQILSGKQLEGSRLQSKWEFLSGKNNETVHFYCILNEKSIDPPCVPVALYTQQQDNNRTAANSRLIWKREGEGKQFTDFECEPFFSLKSLRWSAVVIAV